MAGGAELRVATVAVLLVLLAGAVVAARLRRPAGEQRLGLWMHLEELRRRILRVAAVVLLGMTLALTVRLDVVGGWPVPSLSLYDALAAQLFQAMTRQLVPTGVQLVVLTPMDGFMAQFMMALGVGLLLGVPVALGQAAGFLAPALRPHERRVLRVTVLPAAALFVAGAWFAYALVLPITLQALYQFSDGLGAEGLLNVGDFGAFVLSFLLGFGVAFQTPVVMVAVARAGLVEPATYWRYWRHAVLVLLVIAMVVTPDPTILSQLMLAGPLFGLYLLGAGWASLTKRPPSSAAG